MLTLWTIDPCNVGAAFGCNVYRRRFDIWVPMHGSVAFHGH